MSRRKIVYKSLIEDEGFRDLNLNKLRYLIGLGLAEAVGTGTFMILGCSNVVAHLTGSEATHLNTVISFAFGISTSIMMVGHVSGAIMNPGLNFAAVILGHMSLPRLLLYCLFQLLGASIGVAFVKAVTPNLPQGFCVVQPNISEVGLWPAIAVEFFATFVLAFVFCSVLDKRNAPDANFIFLKFGMAITALAIPTAKYSGCSMNPARAFGPALVMGLWDYHWIYWVAPVLASCFTALIYRAFFDVSLHQESAKSNSNHRKGNNCEMSPSSGGQGV